MQEHLKRQYLEEEEFLDEYSDVASVAEKVLNGQWVANYGCNDVVRKNQEYFLSTGELQLLVFDSAAVYHDAHGFSSVLIVLKSSQRAVTVQVRKADGGLVGEKIVDKSHLSEKP